ncbi:hypothetical protein TrLO_g4591 [Triparma laevis f. longispina]|uniref:Uncharacterized protein n=1 Tax=Triparma laevis f. longispina TaxID=1714387 RepID=A0A9W7L0F9_9STRA|nr:hypothetical protein TrLO_g4591 [Triparma laevis f. longispina]
MAFYRCYELKTMTIPDSLQTIGVNVFRNCSKLVPFNIDVNDDNKHVTPEVFELLRVRSKFTALEMQLSKQSAMFETKICTLSAQNESLHASTAASIASLKQSLQILLPPPTTTKRKHS